MNKKVLVCLMALMASVCSWGTINSGEEYTWNSTTKTLTIYKSGDFADGIMDNFSAQAAPWWSACHDKVEKLVISDGITHIGSYSFDTEFNLLDVTLPASLSSIGENAFNYSGDTKVANVYYKGTPAQWVSIEFRGSSGRLAHPFGKSTASNRKLYFYGITSSAPSTVFIEPTVTEIKNHAFYNVKSITTICIPGTVANIRQYAFYNCSGLNTIIINKSSAPTVGTSAFYGIAGGTASNVQLYKPSTNSGYNVSPWNTFVKALVETFAGATSGNLSEGSIPWTLDENGVLTIDATDKATKSIEFNLGGPTYPWGIFRRIVYKIKIKGEMTGIGNILRYHYGLSEIIIDQTTIPSAGEEVAVNTVGGTPYNSLYNKRDKLKLSIKQVSLTDESVTNLGSTPWSDNTHWQVQLAEPAVIADNADYTTLLSNIHTYVEKPFDLQINRQLVNGIYNTFCLPVPMSAEEIADVWGAGTRLYEMSTSAGEGEENEMVINFNDASSITAGKPYLIKPANNVSSFTVENVTPSSMETTPSSVSNGDITFYGTLAPRAVTADEVANKSFILLTGTVTEDGQLLTWANDETSLGGMRAYWKMNTSNPSSVPVLRIVEGTTAIGEVRSETANAVRSEKILRNGELIIIRDGVEYTIFGGHRK